MNPLDMGKLHLFKMKTTINKSTYILIILSNTTFHLGNGKIPITNIKIEISFINFFLRYI